MFGKATGDSNKDCSAPFNELRAPSICTMVQRARLDVGVLHFTLAHSSRQICAMVQHVLLMSEHLLSELSARPLDLQRHGPTKAGDWC